MSLKKTPSSSRDFKVASRQVLEKYKDLTFGKKCQKLYSKNSLSKTECNLEVCLSEYINCLKVGYESFSEIESVKNFITREIQHTESLKKKISENKSTNSPIKISLISPLLRNHTSFFNYLISSRIKHNEILQEYLKFRLTAISVWNNYWIMK